MTKNAVLCFFFLVEKLNVRCEPKGTKGTAPGNPSHRNMFFGYIPGGTSGPVMADTMPSSNALRECKLCIRSAAACRTSLHMFMMRTRGWLN